MTVARSPGDGEPKADAEPALDTRLIHSEFTPPAGFAALMPPVHHVSTVVFPNIAETRTRLGPDAYTYGLHATPTTLELTTQIAALEGGTRTLLVPSGLASIALVNLALLESGDHVLIPDNVYRPSREMAERVLQGLGIATDYYDAMAGATVASMIRPNTRLMWIEAPGSITMEVPDVPALVAAARARGVITAIDNTWAAGVFFRAFDFGIDISVQALTKYVAGHSDLLMGSVTANRPELIDRMVSVRRAMGMGVGPDDIYLALRGLPTMMMRLRAHEAAALRVAQWLKQQPEVKRVLHPALPDCPGHEHWKRDFSGSSGLFSVILHERFAPASVDAMVDGLRWFKIGYSWGGVASLAVTYRRDVYANPLMQSEPGTLLRLHIGLESTDDLIADLEAGFGKLRED